MSTRADCRTGAAAHSAGFLQSCSAFVSTVVRRIRQSREVARQRRALARLDDRLLRDIGITRDQAARETGRPFRPT